MTEQEEIERLESYRKSPIAVLAGANLDSLFATFKDEPIRVVAVCVNALMSHDFFYIFNAAKILSVLDDDIRGEVTVMLSCDDWLRRITQSEEDRVLLHIKCKMLHLNDDEVVSCAGIVRTAEMLSYLPANVACSLLDPLKNKDGQLYEDLFEHLFFFDDIALLSDDSVRRILLRVYGIEYIYIGSNEHEAYPDLQLDALLACGDVVFNEGQTYVIHVTLPELPG